MFKKPDRRGWFDYEKCPVCGMHWKSCTCGRDKSSLEKKLEVASNADLITPVAGMLGIEPGCILILCILLMAAMVAVLSR